jgi:acyl carrier protein
MNDKLNEIFADMFDLDRREIRDDLTPQDVELWDSLNHLKLITAIEEAFGIRLSMEEVNAIDSLRKLRALVNGHMGNSTPSPLYAGGTS